MHGRNRTVTPAMFAHIKVRRLRKFSSCLALRHASWRAISQWRLGHDRDGNDRDNAYSSFQLAPLFRVFPVLNKRSPRPPRPGAISTPVSAVLLRGQTTVVSDASLAFWNLRSRNIARCPECDGKQEILRSSQLSEFSTGRAYCGVASSGTNRPRVATLNLC